MMKLQRNLRKQSSSSDAKFSRKIPITSGSRQGWGILVSSLHAVGLSEEAVKDIRHLLSGVARSFCYALGTYVSLGFHHFASLLAVDLADLLAWDM